MIYLSWKALSIAVLCQMFTQQHKLLCREIVQFVTPGPLLIDVCVPLCQTIIHELSHEVQLLHQWPGAGEQLRGSKVHVNREFA